MTFEDFLADLADSENASTEDILASYLPLLREVIAAHQQGLVAPLEGTQALHVEGMKLWFEEALRQPVRLNKAGIARLEAADSSLEILSETRLTTAVDDAAEQLIRSEIGTRGTPPTRSVFLPGYVAWEHELGHHDPLTDIHSLGLILASLACGLNLSEPDSLESFVAHRMSPLSVSDTLPLATDFVDVVIFDEASQVTLEEAVPSLFRGQQVIVVGDEMQLQPTDFFSAKRSGGDDDDPQDAEDEEVLHSELTSDSFLSHAAKNLPATMLGWHYRSRSESLISFSNWAFYDGRLLTVPEHRITSAEVNSTTAALSTSEVSPVELLLSRPVSFHLLPSGSYDKRRNRAEADHIAQLVADLLKRREGKSLGVIAFSEAQQAENELALNRLAGEDDEFRRLLDEEWQREVDGQFVGLLVKNLENIQGDERDIIILSICYGPGPNGKMLMNFGPINRSGGEKRLNVAFSRAKQHMAIVSTIRYSAITNEYNEGANCLRNYLRYAEAMSQRDSAAAQRVLKSIIRWKGQFAQEHSDSEDGVVVQLADHLRAQGYLVDLGVGQSHFRVDLAVRLPTDSGYRLGILIDTPIQYEQVESLERDVLRPRLLHNFGWQVTSVLAKDWYENQQKEMDRLLKILSGDTDDDDLEEESAEAVSVREIIDSLPVSSAGSNATEPTADQEQANSHSTNLVADSLPLATLVNHGDSAIDQVTRRFEYRKDLSSKFWEITVNGLEHTVRFGKIGKSGQTQTKTFGSAAAAQQEATRLIVEKKQKGYIEASD